MSVLKKARKDSGLLAKEVAEKSKINRVHYWNIENGRKRAGYECAVRISKAFDGAVSPIQIMKLYRKPKAVRAGIESAA